MNLTESETLMTLSEAQARATRRAANRGCGPDCACPECISDEIDVAAARWGLDVDAVIAAGNEARAAGTTRKPRGGNGNGAGSGKPARKRRVPAPSVKQFDFIARLWAEREFESPLVAQLLAEETYDEEFGGKAASAFIEMLMKLPRRGAKARQADSARVEVELEEGALYAHDHPSRTDLADVEVYRVQRSKSSGKLYALRVLEGGGTEYAPGMVTRLDPARKLTLDEAQAWGRRTGTCCACYRTLTNPASIEAGVGPICRAKGWG